ncbi:MAG: deoxyguanosinetriphosphate triphosphohydrolase [Cyclobacteriaceae bacterium]|nr:deoxyguanosinetriphosphate triphosphohydrolase [Cyclobacteriaceae bacterium]
MNWIQLLSDQRPGEKRKEKNSQRSKFEQDYDRIIFSHPFRMLQDKTQVFPLAKQDFVHTRLTHSLEVASVGRSLGKLAGEIVLEKHPEVREEGFTSSDFGAIVSAASLMHDMGNPPFGHAGENAISEFFKKQEIVDLIKHQVAEMEWEDLTNFEGNAQGFRLANKQNYQGLKLTFATLGAFTKYPRESKIELLKNDRKSQKKYGFLQSNKAVFQELAEGMGLIRLGNETDAAWCRHPLAFLVEAADDICYSIIDLEDGTNLELVTLEETKSLLVEIIGDAFQEEKFNRIQSKKEQVSVLRAMAISRLIIQSVDKFMEFEEQLLDGTFDKALTGQIGAAPVLEKIQSISFEKIYKSKPVIEREIAGFEVLDGLLETFVPAMLNLRSAQKLSWHNSSLLRLLPQDFLFEIENSGNLYESLLVLLDFISGLTDSHALSIFRNIKGISLPGV